jgi:EAL domain-containing protein (putative c-di-GMP-specific phosphodiesterase class I)
MNPIVVARQAESDKSQLLKGMEAELSGWTDPEAHLRGALEKNELCLYCQPIRALVGSETYPLAEVLVRLRAEESALLPPGEFFPIFEHYRMMPALDLWVVQHVLERIARGSRIGCLAVNISSQSLEDASFSLSVGELLAASKVSPTALCFELAESDTLQRLDRAVHFGKAMEELGCRIVIDGFGQKSVTFAALKVLHVGFLKVDGSIIRKLLTSEMALTKYKAILRVCAAIGVAVIAEHVEEQDILMRLKALGTDYVQGFGIYEPQPLEAIAAVDIVSEPGEPALR